MKDRTVKYVQREGVLWEGGGWMKEIKVRVYDW
jgi:hypothetical protein